MKLVVLEYSDNSCYTNVLSLEGAEKKYGPSFSVDIKKKTWSFHVPYEENTARKIGSMRHVKYGCRGGIIGVYDIDDMNQLNWMLDHSKEATRSHNCGNSDEG